MKPVYQTSFYDPETGKGGNCVQAAVASIFGIDLDEVPNFLDHAEKFLVHYMQFIRGRGYSIISLALETAKDLDAHYLALGPSARGCGHAAVYRKGQLVHDPHPSNKGLLSVDFVHLFVPCEFTTQNRSKENK